MSSATETSAQSYYDVLQISHKATSEDIKIAYRSLVIGNHPDKVLASIPQNTEDHIQQFSEGLSDIDIDDDDETNNCSSNVLPKREIIGETSQPVEQKSDEEELSMQIIRTRFHQIQAAYDCLRDPQKRRQYDESISRKEERKEWKWKGATEVNLSEMECDWCCVVDEDNHEHEDDSINGTDDGQMPLQKVFFHPCRCGDMFQVVHEELLESIDDTNGDSTDKNNTFTNRVWRCESCSLMIRIHVDISIND